MREREKIEALLEEHLIAWFKTGDGGIKDHYLVTPVNLADFIDAHFHLRKTPKPWNKVLEDSTPPFLGNE